MFDHVFRLYAGEPGSEPVVVGKTTSRNLSRALVMKADQVFGKDGYRLRSNRTLVGCDAVTTDGRVLAIELE